MKDALWGLLALVLLMVVVGERRDTTKAKQEAASAAEQRDIWQAKYAAETQNVKRDTRIVIRYATRYDTVRAEMDSVLADSAQTVPSEWVRSLVVASDSTIAACRDLVSSCERFRVTADSTIGATVRERDAYRVLWEKERPSRLDKLKPWLFLAGGVYVGAKLRVP